MFDFDFLNLSREEISHYLRSGYNPLLRCRFKGDSTEEIIKMISIIHAAINDYELDPIGHFVYIIGTDSRVHIEEWTTISKLAEGISYAFYEATGVHSEQLSEQKIQTAIHKYLLKNKYLELRDNPYDSQRKSYYATDKGEDCGIRNSQGKGRHKVYYSCYMQACIIRKLPEILSDAAFFEFENSHDMVALQNSIEPLTLEEQGLISEYRALNTANKKLVKRTFETLRTIQAQSEQKKNDN
ncbi:MAG: hypothetical protein K2N23_05730 [Clostridia bacterium]|nr:hypothetical protein [Clostridia bacterium]